MTQKKPSPAEPRRDDAIRDSFPASDPPANPAAAQGARAVPVEAMKSGPAPEPEGAATLSAPFASAEAAKLALEALVREGPLPREHATIESASGGVVLKLRVPAGDRTRIRAMLERETARA